MNKRRQKIIRIAITYFVIIVILFFLILILKRNWTEILAYSYSISYSFLIAAVIFSLLNIVVLASAWRKIVFYIIPNHHLSRKKLFEIYVYSWFAKYIPGVFMAPLGKVYLGSREGLSAKKLALISFLELALAGVSMLFASIISLVFLAFFVGGLKQAYIIIAIVLALSAFVILHPAILAKILNLALKLSKRKKVDRINLLGYDQMLKLIFYYLVSIMCVSISFAFSVISFMNMDRLTLLTVFFSYGIANFIAVISLFAPSGLGMREGVLVLFLKKALSLPGATFAALLSRIVFVFGDIIMFIILLILKKFFWKEQEVLI
jgi:glycosyltransferase 2 family protein